MLGTGSAAFVGVARATPDVDDDEDEEEVEAPATLTASAPGPATTAPVAPSTNRIPSALSAGVRRIAASTSAMRLFSGDNRGNRGTAARGQRPEAPGMCEECGANERVTCEGSDDILVASI